MPCTQVVVEMKQLQAKQSLKFVASAEIWARQGKMQELSEKAWSHRLWGEDF